MSEHCTTTMRLNCGAGRNQQQVRRSLLQKLTASSVKSVAGSVPLLNNPDVDVTVKTNISDGEVLVWDSNQDRFVNATIASIVSGAGLAKRVREIILSSSGDNSNTGTSSTDAIKDLEIGIKEMSNLSTTYEMVQFWITGDSINFNTGNSNGVIRDSVLGNIRRGVCIRGIPNGTTLSPLNATDSPRGNTKPLVSGFANVQPIAQNDLNVIAESTDATNYLNSWITNGNTDKIDTTVAFLTDISHNTEAIYPVVIDGTSNVNPDNSAGGGWENTRLYLATSNGTNPTASGNGNGAFSAIKLATKVVCTNLTEDGGSASTVKPGWSVTGNVQFVQIHFELVNDATPVKFNGEFQILYSLFTNTTPGGTNATLYLAPLGIGDDADSTAQIAPTVNGVTPTLSKEAGKVKRIYKSIFKDLNIQVNSPCVFQDCVFNACKFINPVGAVFENCVFYSARPSVLGAETEQRFLNNSMTLNKCMIVYQASGYFVECSNDSVFEIKNSSARLLTPGGSNQATPFIKANKSTVVVSDLSIPARSGINSTGANNDAAVLVYGNNSTISIKNISIIGDASNTLPFILAKDSCDVVIHDVSNDSVSGGPLLSAHNSDIVIQDLDVTLDASYATPNDSGYFDFHSCNVSVSAKFEVDANATSDVNKIFHLENTKLTNEIGSDAATNKFNVFNDKTQHTFNLINGSELVVTTGDPTSVAAGNQKRLQGRCEVNHYSKLTIIGTDDGSWNPDYSENVNWVMDDGGNGYHLFTIEDHSEVSIDTINSEYNEGSLPAGDYRSRLAKVAKDSLFNTNRSKIVVSGHNTSISLNVTQSSNVNMNNTHVDIGTGSGANLVEVQDNSGLYVHNPEAATATLFKGSISDRLLLVKGNSSAVFTNMQVEAGSTCPQGIKVIDNSKLFIKGTSGHPVAITFTGSSGATDVFFSIDNMSNCTLEHIVYNVGASGGSLLQGTGLCNLYLNGVNAGSGSIRTVSLAIENGTKLYVGSETNDLPAEYAVGTLGGGQRQTITKVNLDTQDIFPQQTEIAAKWNDLRGCMIISAA